MIFHVVDFSQYFKIKIIFVFLMWHTLVTEYQESYFIAKINKRKYCENFTDLKMSAFLRDKHFQLIWNVLIFLDISLNNILF